MQDPYSAKPWLKFYDKHVSPNLNYPDKNFGELFRDALQAVPDKTLVHYMGADLSYRNLDELSNKFANFLKARGLKPGDVVGVNLPNLPAYYIAIVGILRAGCLLSGVSPLLSAKEVAYQLNDSGAKILVTLDLLSDKAAEAVVTTGVQCMVVVEIADFLPAVKRVLGKLLKKIPTKPVPPVPGIEVVRFMEILKTMADTPVMDKIEPGAPCLMQYTGGTTGPAKGAVLTHRNMVCQLTQFGVWVDLKMGQGTMLSAFPLFHQAGLFIGMLAMAYGCTQIAIPNPRDLDFIITAIKKHRPNAIGNVPTLFMELMKKEAFRKLDFSWLEWCGSGAAPFPPEYIREFENIVGKGKLVEVCGMTETSPITTALPLYGMKVPGSVGIPLSDTEAKLVDPETGAIVPVGEPGEFVAKGPQVFTIGYHNKPEETANTLRDGWIYTGDICQMDANGYFYVVDRMKDMVNISGFKVFSRQVDDVLMEHPDIDVAATIGLPDPERPGSEIVVSALVLKPGREKSEAMREKIGQFMKEKVAPYKVPKRIEFMDELPKSAVGKILKRELRAMLSQQGSGP
jgi:acyl-CoA synthetase (AMP-forming)/AMP-acid ligase II